MNDKKTSWSINYEKEFPVITLTDVTGHKQIIDINEIVNKERGKNAIDTLQLIKQFLKKHE